jgi:hypothetical protein
VSHLQPGEEQQVTTTTTDKVKLLLRLTPDEDGYPPFTIEGVWASRNPDGTYEIANIPFYSYDVAVGDVVRAEEIDGELFFVERVKDSGNSVIRMLIYDRDELEKIRADLWSLGCDSEGDGVVLAVNVPAGVSYAPIAKFLDEGDRAKRWGFEEAVLCHPRDETNAQGGPALRLVHDASVEVDK